jgi:transcriptional regulator with XRE-family HTH domain
MALPQSQALLHCLHKAAIYNVEMTMGKRIKAARERLDPRPTQTDIGNLFGITDKAVSAWERDETAPELDKIANLAKALKVPCIWLLEGVGAPPPPDALETRIESLRPSERALVGPMMTAIIEALRKEREPAA